jgi:hypothetical protein
MIPVYQTPKRKNGAARIKSYFPATVVAKPANVPWINLVSSDFTNAVRLNNVDGINTRV